MKIGEKGAAWAKAHTDCSVHHNPALYLESVAPACDREPGPGMRYFMAGPSTCALYASRMYGDGFGLTDKELHESYTLEIGTAVANVQTVASRRGALEQYGHGQHPTEPFCAGDVVTIDGPPHGVHVIVIVGDAVMEAGGRWRTDICQGGQGDGGVASGVCDWEVRADGMMYPSPTSQRRVIMVCRARKFGMDTADTDPAPPMEQDEPETSPELSFVIEGPDPVEK